MLRSWPRYKKDPSPKSNKSPKSTKVPKGNQCVDEGECAPPSLNIRNFAGLKDCLRDDPTSDEPRWDGNVTIADYEGDEGGFNSSAPNAQNRVAPKLSFIDDAQDDYTAAKYSSWGSARNPSGILFAESAEEVMIAVNCARQFGYQVSPRGRGHSYQGLSNMDGFMTVDLSLMCNPKINPEPPKGYENGWLLGEDQKVLGSITVEAGCTNAVMLAATAQSDAFTGEKDGIYLIGSCPSVGITGFATGGGMGDATGYVGMGADDIISFDVVVYNETKAEAEIITASRKENDDLFFALQGGGSGLGVVVSMENLVIESPESSRKPEDREYVSFFQITYSRQDKASVTKFLKRFQDFLVPDHSWDSPEYKKAIREGSSRYGGGAAFLENAIGFNGVFLASEADLNTTLEKYNLLDNDILESFSVQATQKSYGRAMAVRLCLAAPGSWFTWYLPTFLPDSERPSVLFNICEDLGIDEAKYCEAVGDNVIQVQPTADGCMEDEFIDAFIRAARQPQSFINRPGFQGLAEVFEDFVPQFAEQIRATFTGGILVPRVKPEVLYKLFEIGVIANHFANGAATLVPSDKTGYGNREEYMLIEFTNLFDPAGAQDTYDQVADLLIREVYDGDRTKLRGYYNYMNAPGNPNWPEYYFGENVEKLSKIKKKYDPANMFGNFLQIPPATEN
ncbi:hypothetical protein ACHAWF_015531 [Thalassiosira exigua]